MRVESPCAAPQVLLADADSYPHCTDPHRALALLSPPAPHLLFSPPTISFLISTLTPHPIPCLPALAPSDSHSAPRAECAPSAHTGQRELRGPSLRTLRRLRALDAAADSHPAASPPEFLDLQILVSYVKIVRGVDSPRELKLTNVSVV
ncbi:hypothetical protein C8F04DRAFT_1254347 [Mycena alexandri]|uniref:Uncharacterized protein n=1 Tax=Mycena alexandri TaxID=1745969 RepID=A0AAD6T5J4_9AGAR|nr:hypothetical protein C8F04DRAFT_1254347 [Mycena alexandri]